MSIHMGIYLFMLRHCWLLNISGEATFQFWLLCWISMKVERSWWWWKRGDLTLKCISVLRPFSAFLTFMVPVNRSVKLSRLLGKLGKLLAPPPLFSLCSRLWYFPTLVLFIAHVLYWGRITCSKDPLSVWATTQAHTVIHFHSHPRSGANYRYIIWCCINYIWGQIRSIITWCVAGTGHWAFVAVEKYGIWLGGNTHRQTSMHARIARNLKGGQVEN